MLPTSPRTFVGLENYKTVFAMPDLGMALLNTLWYLLAILPFSVLLPLLIVVYTDSMTKHAKEAFRAIVFLPMVLSPVVVALVWEMILHPTVGLVGQIIQSFGGTSGPNFFAEGNLPILSIMGISAWKIIGFSTLIYASALTAVNRSCLEAGVLDGAGFWQLLIHIRIPLMSPSICLMVMMSVLFSSQWSFAYINVLTQGGPANAPTSNLYYLLWRFGFTSFSAGWSSAVAVFLFALYGVISFILLRITRSLEFYDN
jgi:multiple sugar transport system permease protein